MLKWIYASKNAGIDQTIRLVNTDFTKPLCISDAYVARKRHVNPPTIGLMVVASTATAGLWVQAIKNKLNKTVDGKPLTSPPILEPSLSANTVAKIIQSPPKINDRESLRKNIESIIEL